MGNDKSAKKERCRAVESSKWLRYCDELVDAFDETSVVKVRERRRRSSLVASRSLAQSLVSERTPEAADEGSEGDVGFGLVGKGQQEQSTEYGRGQEGRDSVDRRGQVELRSPSSSSQMLVKSSASRMMIPPVKVEKREQCDSIFFLAKETGASERDVPSQPKTSASVSVLGREGLSEFSSILIYSLCGPVHGGAAVGQLSPLVIGW